MLSRVDQPGVVFANGACKISSSLKSENRGCHSRICSSAAGPAELRVRIKPCTRSVIHAMSATNKRVWPSVKTVPRKPSAWSNWRTLVREPGRTAHRAEPLVAARMPRLPLSSALCWRRRRESASALPDRIARKSSRACFFCCSRFKTASFVCLVRMTGERGSTEKRVLKRAGGRGPFRGQDASCTRLHLSLPK